MLLLTFLMALARYVTERNAEEIRLLIFGQLVTWEELISAEELPLMEWC